MTASGWDRAPRDAAEAGQVIPLPVAEIHLWLTFYDQTTGEHLHSAYREVLSAAEREQETRFYFARDRRRYLTTRALVRTTLSHYVSIHPKDWIFSTNAYGRPEIVNPHAKNASLVFNISHCHSLIVLAVSRRRALGVDVENFRAREVAMDLPHHYFAAQETAMIASVPADQQQYRFFEYWTFKEAYIKARGMGLSLPLDKLSFHYPDNKTVQIAIDPELADDSARWQFWQLRPTPDYLVAVCGERAGIPSPSLVVRQVIPMLSEDEVNLEVLRTSA
jgi:4'-phosphopantetheinyl transferase